MNLERYEGAWNEGLLGPSFLTALLEIFAQVRKHRSGGVCFPRTFQLMISACLPLYWCLD